MSETQHNIAATSPTKTELDGNGLTRYGKMMIDNEWVWAMNGNTFQTFYPGNGKVIANVASADKEDVELAVQAARRAFEAGDYKKMNGADRGKLLWRIADLMEQNIEELAELESFNNGKPIVESMKVDLPQSIECFRYFAGWAGKTTGETIEPNSRANALTFTLREPIGVCGQIIPWNFPIQMAAWKLAPAIACGNTVVIKPAEQTPLSLLRLGELMIEAGMPKGVVNIITGLGETAGAAIVENRGVDKIAFTGSVEVGKVIMRNAANTLKKVTLELGGKSPHVVFADSNVELAAKVALMGIFFNQGQMCTAGSRILVETKAYDQFIDVLGSRAKQMQVGDPLNPKTRVGALVSSEQLERVLGYINKGKEGGATLIAGGEQVASNGFYLQPTVFDNVENNMVIAQEEIFGPVASVIKFDDPESALKIANDSNFGLAAGVWTNDIKKAVRFAKGVKAGSVWVNTYNMTDNALPFGGFKNSGIGREMGKAALDIYTETKTVWIDLN